MKGQIMDWIKVKAEHISPEYSDSQVGALIRFQLLVARLKRVPTDKELFREVSKKNWSKLLESMELIYSSTEVGPDLVANKVLEDVEKIERKREVSRNSSKKLRSRHKESDASRDVGSDGACDVPDKIRVDKSREYKKTNNNLIDQKTLIDNKTYEECFNLIWSKYPRKEGRKGALTHFKASIKNPVDFQDIQVALYNYLEKIRVEKVKPQFVMQGKTWFNNWKDYIFYQPIEIVGNDKISRTMNAAKNFLSGDYDEDELFLGSIAKAN